MKKSFFAAIVAALVTLSACTVSGPEDHSGHIEVSNPYVRAADAVMTGMFLEITNNHDEDLVLVGGSSDAAEMIEIHTVVDGVMQKLEGGLTIAVGATETLKPGGNHVMLMGLTRPLEIGDEVTVTLTFDNGESIDVTAPVKEVNLDQEHYDPDATHSAMS